LSASVGRPARRIARPKDGGTSGRLSR